jgi:hypothetical protein
MAGGDPDDIRRSLRRYVAQILGAPPWTVRLQRTRVDDDERPVAILDPGVMTTPFARAGMRDGNQGDVQKMRPFTVVCYPALGDTAAVSGEEAEQLASLLDAGFQRGLVTGDVPPVNIGAPYRIPVYDFAGVPMTGPDRAGATSPYMYANVDETINVRPIQDALDELRYTVVVNLRVSWWQGGRVLPATPIATTMPGTFAGEAAP